MGIVYRIIQFLKGKREEDEDKEERGSRLHQNQYRTLPHLPGQNHNVHRPPYYYNTLSNFTSSEPPPNKILSFLSFICRPLKFILAKLPWPFSILPWARKSHDQNLPVQYPQPVVTYDLSLFQNLPISLPRNDSIRKPSLKSAPAPALVREIIAPIKTSPVIEPQPRLPYKDAPIFPKPIFSPVLSSPLYDPPPRPSHKNAIITSPQAKTGHPEWVTVSVPKFTASLAYTIADKEIQVSAESSPIIDPKPRLPHKDAPIFPKARFAPVESSPLNDPPPRHSYKNAVVTPAQGKSGHPEGVTVFVPKFTSSLAYTAADKAIQDSVVLPKKLTGKSVHLDRVMVSVPKCKVSLEYTASDKAIHDSSVLSRKVSGKNGPKKVSDKSEPKKRIKEDKKGAVDIKPTIVVHEGRWIKHYSSRHRILLVGDGDFSFSVCLATAFGCASNMIATSLDTKEFLKKNYNRAESNLKELKQRQCKVLHGIDATKMAAHELLGQLTFDRIIYNFPFAGFFKTLSRDTQIRRHRSLVSKFLKNAKEMVSENGEIHISHKTNGFHAEWNLECLASSHRLRLIEAVNFSLGDYPGYNTKCGFGSDNNFDCNPSKTYKFGIKWVCS